MPENEQPKMPEPGPRFERASGYVDFCREHFCEASVLPWAIFDDAWKTAWAEHFRYVKMGLATPFFFAHDVLRILADPALPLKLNGRRSYGAMMKSVARLVAGWEAFGGFAVNGQSERGRFLAFRPLFHELFLALELNGLSALFVADIDKALKWNFEKEDPEKWRKADGRGFAGGSFFGGVFENNRVSEIMEEAPEIFERCLGLCRYEMRLSGEGSRRLAGPGAEPDGLSEEDFKAQGEKRPGFRRAMWGVACDLSLMDDYRKEAARPPTEATLSAPGRFTRPVVGEWEKSGFEHRVIGQGAPPGHPLALGAPKPVVMRLMAENKVPAYLDVWQDRESLSTGVVFAIDLPSARTDNGAGRPEWGLTGALKLAAFLVAHDLLALPGLSDKAAFDVAFMFHDQNWGDAGGITPKGLAPSVRTTVLAGSDFSPGRSRGNLERPLLFSASDVFPVLFNHAPGWSWKKESDPAPKEAAGGALSGKIEPGEPVSQMLAQWKNLMADRRDWGRKLSFFMGGPGFSEALGRSLRQGGSPMFQFISGRSDALVVEARPGEGGGRPFLVFGNLDGASSSKGRAGREERSCPHPFQGFRSWALTRILSPKSL